MARISIEFTEDTIKVIKWLRFKQLEVRHEKSNLSPVLHELADILAETTIDESDRYLIEDILTKINNANRLSLALSKEDEDKYYGFDTYDFFDGIPYLSQVALILGRNNDVIEGTETNYGGPQFTQETTEYINDLMSFINTNLVSIEEIIHQRCDKGGILPNVKYVASDNEHIWYTEEEYKERRKKK